MKNVLARGGIEFIAVILGLSGSLWIDNANEVNNNNEYNALKNSGRMDLINNEALIIKLHNYYTQLRFIKVIETNLQKVVADDVLPLYKKEVKRVTELRQILREELKL